jgi:uncharacterized protein YegP (UPF0339 family)
MRFEINKANSGLFQFRFLNAERTTLLQSESYENLENCVAAIQNFVPVAALSENYAFDIENEKHFFQIIDKNGCH